jgi:hypothetical protein
VVTADAVLICPTTRLSPFAALAGSGRAIASAAIPAAATVPPVIVAIAG